MLRFSCLPNKALCAGWVGFRFCRFPSLAIVPPKGSFPLGGSCRRQATEGWPLPIVTWQSILIHPPRQKQSQYNPSHRQILTLYYITYTIPLFPQKCAGSTETACGGYSGESRTAGAEGATPAMPVESLRQKDGAGIRTIGYHNLHLSPELSRSMGRLILFLERGRNHGTIPRCS